MHHGKSQSRLVRHALTPLQTQLLPPKEPVPNTRLLPAKAAYIHGRPAPRSENVQDGAGHVVLHLLLQAEHIRAVSQPGFCRSIADNSSRWLAARELRQRSWRFHKQYLTWFQRYSQPQAITDEYEQGQYTYFDWEGRWTFLRKADFRFMYVYLSDE
jgi:hypothetical protein